MSSSDKSRPFVIRTLFVCVHLTGGQRYIKLLRLIKSERTADHTTEVKLLPEKENVCSYLSLSFSLASTVIYEMLLSLF